MTYFTYFKPRVFWDAGTVIQPPTGIDSTGTEPEDRSDIQETSDDVQAAADVVRSSLPTETELARPYTPELNTEMLKFAQLSANLAQLQAKVAALIAEAEAMKQFKFMEEKRRQEEELLAAIASDMEQMRVKRLAVARQILDMQEEEELMLMMLMMH